MPVSETEKHGVLASGCRFSNKAEHVPIKKRRFLLRSPSPPPVNVSPCNEETADQTRRQEPQDASIKVLPLPSSSSDINASQIVETKNHIDAKKSNNPNKSFGEDEDFSGISILAAAACSSSLGRDCGYAEDGSGIEESSELERVPEVSTYTETRSLSKGLWKEDMINLSEISSGATSCISTEPIVELASISNNVNSSQNAAGFGKVKDPSLGSDSLAFPVDVSCSNAEGVGKDQRQSSRDVRLHWDLNVVMDAWEEPFDDPGVQNVVAHDIAQDAVEVNHNDKMESEVHDLQESSETLYAANSSLLPGEQRASANQSSVDVKGNHEDIDACLSMKQPLCLGEKPLSTNSNHNLDALNCMVEDTKCRHHDETVDPTVASVTAALDQTAQLSASCTINETEDASVKCLDLNDNRLSYRPVIEGFKTDRMPSCQLMNLGNACASDTTFGAVAADSYFSLCISSSSKAKQNVAISEDSETPKIFLHEENSLIENADLKTVEHQDHAEVSISDDDGLPLAGASNPVSKRCELLVAFDTKVQGVDYFPDGNIISNNENLKNLSENCSVTLKDSSDFSNHETCKTNLENCSNYSDNIDHENFLKHCNDIGVQCYPVLVSGTDATGELQEGYDSQYEDGELRESSGRAWDEYDAVGREDESVDYI